MASEHEPGQSGGEPAGPGDETPAITPIPRDPWIAEVVGDAANPQPVQLLTGYVGDAAEAGRTRIYFDPSLTSYVDVADEDVIRHEPLEGDHQPAGGAMVWVRAQQPAAAAGGDFFTGPVMEQQLMADGPVTVNPALCKIGPITQNVTICQIRPTAIGPRCPVGPITKTIIRSVCAPCIPKITVASVCCIPGTWTGGTGTFQMPDVFPTDRCPPSVMDSCPTRPGPCFPQGGVTDQVNPAPFGARLMAADPMNAQQPVGPTGWLGCTQAMGCPNTSTCTPQTHALGCPSTSTCTPQTHAFGCPDTSTCTPQTHAMGCPDTSTCTPEHGPIGVTGWLGCQPTHLIGCTGWLGCGQTQAMGCPNTSTCTPQTHALGCPSTSTCPPHDALTLQHCPTPPTGEMLALGAAPQTTATVCTQIGCHTQGLGCPSTSTCPPQQTMATVCTQIGCHTQMLGCPNTRTCPPQQTIATVCTQIGCPPPGGPIGVTGWRGCTQAMGCPSTSTCPPQTHAFGCPRTSTCPPTFAPGCPSTSTCPPQGEQLVGVTGWQGCTQAMGCPNTSTCTPQTYAFGCPNTSTCTPQTHAFGCPSSSTCPPPPASAICATAIAC